jgi:hypothetical protein
MRHLVIGSGIILGILALLPVPTRGDLLKVTEPLSYPVIAADVNGRITYEYDASSGRGTFSMRNTPVLLASGSAQNSYNEFTIDATSGGDRYQSLRFQIDPTTGQLVDDPSNSYKLYGKVTALVPNAAAPDKLTNLTFEGLLLEGKPQAFGSVYKGPNPSDGIKSVFDSAIEITGGQLAPFFGKDTYIKITPLRENTFTGVFTEDFYATKAASNTIALAAPQPFPIPEPTALVFLIVGGGGGLLFRHRRRLRG